jgi:hypothetical protein
VSGSATVPAAFGATLLGLLLLAGCPGGPRALVADQAVHVISPAPLATVSQPFTVAWRGPGRRYVVFVDSSPISSGGSLRDIAPSSCRKVPTCQPSVSYLATIGVYVTQSDQVTVSSLNGVTGVDSRQSRPVHRATVVVVDSNGRRIGSQAWQVEFHA